MTDMRPAQFKAFHAVARHGSFSGAAERLALTQPALSDHIRKLEENYGVQLFVRTPRGVSLTDLGRRLYAVAERHFESEAEAVEILSRARSLDEGQLTIGADAAVHILPDIARFRARYPGIAIRMVSGNSAALLARLHAFEIDVAVTGEAPASVEILARKLRQDRLVVLAAAASETARAGRIGLSAIAGQTIILREEGSITRRLLISELQARDLVPSSVIEMEGREAVREAVAQGMGLAIMSEAELVPDPRLKALAIADWKASMQEWLLCLKSRAGLHVIRSFIDLAAASGKRPPGVVR